jgi:CRP-like cAMP-binding protein
LIVQIAGSGLQIDTATLKRMVKGDGELSELFHAYNLAFQFQVSQSVACNGLHSVQQRCCRWLLMTHDRVEGNDIDLTHEFLAAMLGVRRAGVGEVLQELQLRGLLDNSRHKITILDRKGMEKVSCECYQDVQDEYRRLLG